MTDDDSKPTRPDPHLDTPDCRVYGNWFSKDGNGPTTVMLRFLPLQPISERPFKVEDQILLMRVQPSPAERFNFGDAPLGAGPSLSYESVKNLHAILSTWILAVGMGIDPKASRVQPTGMSLAQMIAGLVRYAELRERDEPISDGQHKIWDDESRAALSRARELGWGNGQIGRLP